MPQKLILFFIFFFYNKYYCMKYTNNIKILILSIAVIFWFRGMYRLLDKYIDNTVVNNIVLVIIALSIMFLVKGDLSPLGRDDNDDNGDNNKMLHAAASYNGMNGSDRIKSI